MLAVHLPENQGYGGGIRAGLRALAQGPDPAVLGWTWGDGQVDPAVIPALYQCCLDGADLAHAVRVERHDGLGRSAQAVGYRLLLRSLGVALRDLHGCPKLLRRDALAALDLQHDDWFLDAEAMLGARDRGMRIAEREVVMRARQSGRSHVRLATVGEFVVNLGRWRLGR